MAFPQVVVTHLNNGLVSKGIVQLCDAICDVSWGINACFFYYLSHIPKLPTGLVIGCASIENLGRGRLSRYFVMSSV